MAGAPSSSCGNLGEQSCSRSLAASLFAVASLFAAASFGDARFRDGCSPLGENPARGPAPGGWHVLGKAGNAAGSPQGFCSWLWSIGEFSGGNQYGTNAVPHWCIGGEDLPLTPDALAAVSNTLVNARSNGATMVVRFGYTSGRETGAEPSSFDTIVGHVNQIAPILGAFPDVVLAVECCMVGPWGEMHSSNYREPDQMRALMNAWLAALAEPTALLVRQPTWILEYAGKGVDAFMAEVADGTYCTVQPAQRRIGMFNDGYLGSASDYGTWRAAANSMTRGQGVEYLESRRNVPYGGELAYLTEDEADAAERDLFDAAKYNVVQEFYRTHLGYLRNIDTKNHLLAGRIEGHLLTHDYDFAGMPDLAEWYGRDMRSFIRAHMGYRFVVRNVAFASGNVDVTVENTGFGHLLVKSLGEISAGGVASIVDFDLRDLRPGERKAYSLPMPASASADVPVLLSVRLDTPAAQSVHFANDALRVGDATCLRGVQRTLGGEGNASNVGSASRPVSWGDASNWTPAQVPCGVDAANWAPSKTGSHRTAYVELDGDYGIGYVTNRWRSLALYKAGGGASTATFTVNVQLGNSGYQHHVVGGGVRLVLPPAASLVWGLSDGVRSDLTLSSGAAAEIFSSVESQMTEYVVNDGSSLVFDPSSYLLRNQGASGRYDVFSVNGGEVSLPGGLNVTADSGSTSQNNVQQFNQAGGTVTFGGSFVSALPWAYTWSGGALNVTGDCAFGANIALVVPASASVALDVAAGKTFSAPGLSV
ncbi:MAG: DUF4874 domain-containing protein, partial [Kiritimatiellae bacterium]|nr:DUF4874 domain-containing protein [Kiritimatiellia bacterium]